MLIRPKPFGSQSVNQVRGFNRKTFKVGGKDKSKTVSKKHRIGRSKSAAAFVGAAGDDEAEARLRQSSSYFSPMQEYRDAMDRAMEKQMPFLEHPFMDPQRKMEPAYSISGRWKDPSTEEEEIPEYVIERGPHGTWMRRRVGFLEVHEALKRLGKQPPAFTIRERLPSEFDKRNKPGATSESLGVGHESWEVDPKGRVKGSSFGIRHRHLDPKDFEGPGPTAYDATEAFNKLKNPGKNEVYKQVSLGAKLVDIVNKDILTFPGPNQYVLPPGINTDKDNKFNRTPGGYFSPKLVDLVNKDLLTFPAPGKYNLDGMCEKESRWKEQPAYSFYGGYGKEHGKKKPGVSRARPGGVDTDDLIRSIQQSL